VVNENDKMCGTKIDAYGTPDNTSHGKGIDPQ
jgi:hypothetical protein